MYYPCCGRRTQATMLSSMNGSQNSTQCNVDIIEDVTVQRRQHIVATEALNSPMRRHWHLPRPTASTPGQRSTRKAINLDLSNSAASAEKAQQWPSDPERNHRLFSLFAILTVANQSDRLAIRACQLTQYVTKWKSTTDLEKSPKG